MHVAGFDWNKANWPKCGKHGVTKDEIEALFKADPGVHSDPTHSRQEERKLAVGITQAGRWLIVAFTFRWRERTKLIRPFSARYMHSKEIKHYEQQKES